MFDRVLHVFPKRGKPHTLLQHLVWQARNDKSPHDVVHEETGVNMTIKGLGLLHARHGALGAVMAFSFLLADAANAQAHESQALRNVVQLSASGSVEVEQDWLSMRLAAMQQGKDAAAVQSQLQAVVDAALRTLRAHASGQHLQVRTAGFGVYPRYGSGGQVLSWQGQAHLLLEGKDFARITHAAAQVTGMAVEGVSFGLSKEGSAQVLEQAQAQAVASFKARAQHLTQQFGFSSYTLREVNVNSQDHYPVSRVQPAMAVAAKADMAEAMTVQAGTAEVTVNISGAVQMH